MKKILLLLIIVGLLLSGCGDTMIINGDKYDTYGFLNQEEKKNPDIEYHLIMGNVIWSMVLVYSVVAPIYFLGFSLYEPVGLKSSSHKIGVIN